MGQYKFKTLTLKGNEKVRVDSVDHLCNARCWHYINAGEPMIRWGSYEAHVDCAQAWCDERGIETNYRI